MRISSWWKFRTFSTWRPPTSRNNAHFSSVRSMNIFTHDSPNNDVVIFQTFFIVFIVSILFTALCTEWPKGLNAAAQRAQTPISVTTRDYVFAYSSARDPRSRLVSLSVRPLLTQQFEFLHRFCVCVFSAPSNWISSSAVYARSSILAQVPLASLQLDAHAHSKMIRLVGPERYDAANDTIVLESARCPTRKQNYDFLRYVLQVCLHAWEEMSCAARPLHFVAVLAHGWLLCLLYLLCSTRNVAMYEYGSGLLAGALPRVACHRGLGARRARGRRAHCARLRALALGAERLEAVAACVPRGLHEQQVRRSGLRSTHALV